MQYYTIDCIAGTVRVGVVGVAVVVVAVVVAVVVRAGTDDKCKCKDIKLNWSAGTVSGAVGAYGARMRDKDVDW